MSTSIPGHEGSGLSKKNSTIFRFKLNCIAIVGGLSLGYDTAVISGSIPDISTRLQLGEWALGWAVGCMLIGCAAGSLIAGIVADLLGRRFMLLACAAFFVATRLIVILSPHLYSLWWFRIIGGLGVGAVALLAPLYLSELASPSLKGKLVARYQSAIVFGILLAYFSSGHGTELNNWSWMLALQLILSVLFGILAFRLPETPGYLAKKGKLHAARNILVMVTTADSDEANQESQALEDSHIGSYLSKGAVHFKQLFKSPFLGRLLIGILIGVCQQLTGINAILYYAPVIFKEMGADAATSSLQTIWIGATTVITAVAMIYVADKMNRKKVMIGGSLVMIFLLTILAVCFKYKYFHSPFTLGVLLLHVGVFSCTLGTVILLCLVEIFPGHIRGWAMSIAILALWLADFAVTFTFPAMEKYIGMPGTLGCYTLMCIIICVLICWKVPETKGLTFEEIPIHV